MKILVDADACPVKDIIVKLAKRRHLPVTMFSADIRLVNLISPGDIVVTQDFGVAAMSLARGAKALNQNGMIYSDKNMDRLLFERALGQKIRRAGGKAGKNRKRTSEDDKNFEAALSGILCWR